MILSSILAVRLVEEGANWRMAGDSSCLEENANQKVIVAPHLFFKIVSKPQARITNIRQS